MALIQIWWVLIYLLLVGMAAGWLAWILLGKKKSLSKARRQPNYAILLPVGVAGSFVGGLVVSLLMGDGLTLRPSGMLASVAGAVAVAAVYVWFEGRNVK